MTQGIIRAMGYQKYAAYACLISYWFISFPLTYLFTFVCNLGIRGIFLGLPFGLSTLGLIFLYLIYTTDFNDLSVIIISNIEKSEMSKCLSNNII